MSESTLDIVTINVGGCLFQTSRSTLENSTGTRLSNPGLMSTHALPTADNYFFDRDPLVFHYILNFHRTGELHLPPGACSSALKKELEFWMIPEGQVSECCWKTLYGTARDAEALRELNNLFYYDNLDYMRTFKEWKSKWNKICHKIWMFLEYPNSSIAARIWGLLIYCLIIVSAMLLLLETMPALRQPDEGLQGRCNSIGNITVASQLLKLPPMKVKFLMKRELDSLIILDIILTGLFTIEFFARLIVCPRKRMFMKSFLNICDLLFISTRWSTYVMKNTICLQEQEEQVLIVLFLCLNAFGSIRLIRLFRIGSSFQGFKVMLLAIKYSRNELFLLICTFLIITSSFAVLVFLAEIFKGTFGNCFIAWWWSVVTITTVGYGDLYPVTPVGRVIGSVCAVVGLVMLALPIAVIGTNFSEFYSVNKDKELYAAARKKKCTVGGKKFCFEMLSQETKRVGDSSERS